MFYTGQKVTRKFQGPWRSSKGKVPSSDRHPIFGKVYTVLKTWHDTRIGCNVIWLVEFSDPAPGYINPYPYAAECFRPAVERKTDISIFTEMLNTKEDAIQ